MSWILERNKQHSADIVIIILNIFSFNEIIYSNFFTSW